MTRSYTFGVLDRTVLATISAIRTVALAIAPIALRLALATPFFRSGLTRWDGWFSLSPATTYLFEEEFKLHLFGRQLSFPWPDLIAHVVATAEIGLPILLVFGLGTRFAALALLVMTAVIELVVPDGWANFHIHWAAEAIAIIALGPGPLSLDHAIRVLAGAGPRDLDALTHGRRTWTFPSSFGSVSGRSGRPRPRSDTKAPATDCIVECVGGWSPRHRRASATHGI